MKEYEFHPLAGDYDLFSAHDLGRMEEAMRERGFDPRFPVVLYQGKILDGRNRYLAAKGAGLKKLPTVVFKGTADEAAIFVRTANEERRHLAVEWLQHRRRERIERVAAARQEGKSLPAIAEQEDVSVSQVQRDLDKAGSTLPGGKVEPPEGKVTGKDGRTRTATPAKQPTLCDRCKRVAPGVGLEDCKGCADARRAAGTSANGTPAKKPARKPPEPRAELKDRVGNVLPDGPCRDAFADPALPELIEELEVIEGMFRVKPWVEKAGKLLPHYPWLLLAKFDEHAYEAHHRVQVAIEALKAGVPHALCPKCAGLDSNANGKVCKGCRGSGLVPETRYQELTK
jgi:hypothetical protein